MSAPIPRCILDRARPCMSCVAPSPQECPYPYLLGQTCPEREPTAAG